MYTRTSTAAMKENSDVTIALAVSVTMLTLLGIMLLNSLSEANVIQNWSPLYIEENLVILTYILLTYTMFSYNVPHLLLYQSNFLCLPVT